MLLDLLSLVSVKRLARTLVQRGKGIDVLILNAGIGGWKGLNWPVAAWSVITDTVNATTYPTYKLGDRGRAARMQMGGEKSGVVGRAGGMQEQEQEPRLGEVFTANVFGHYMLTHLLMPVLKGDDEDAARIVWVSSIEAYPHSFRTEDLQGMDTDAPYESSKRLTDLLALTSGLPATRLYTSTYLDGDEQGGSTPKIYVCHPGICATSIADLHVVLHYCMLGVMYLARWLGSPWHPVSAYLGAVAPVWLALAAQSTLAELEEQGGKGKWGSSTDREGSERVIRTEVSGWGWGGTVGEKADGSMRSNHGRWKGMVDVTDESRAEFEATGREVWKEMEELRVEWEARLKDV